MQMEPFHQMTQLCKLDKTQLIIYLGPIRTWDFWTIFSHISVLFWHRHSSDKSEQSIFPSQTLNRGTIILPSKHWKQLEWLNVVEGRSLMSLKTLGCHSLMLKTKKIFQLRSILMQKESKANWTVLHRIIVRIWRDGANQFLVTKFLISSK